MLAGTVFEHLHRPDSWDAVWTQVTDVAALTQAVGGKHIVVIPDVWRHHKTGDPVESRDLSEEQWAQLTSGLDELGRRILEEYGLRVQFHSHADSHVGYQPDIERLLASTNPDYVNLCFDTGHIAYYGGDCLELIQKYPDRIGYLHLKQVNPEIISFVLDRDLSFPEAVRMGAMIEPPLRRARDATLVGGGGRAGPRPGGDHRARPLPVRTRPAAADRQADAYVPRAPAAGRMIEFGHDR